MAAGSLVPDELDSELARIKHAIRESPAAPEHRIAYFQLLCIKGDWERANDQLKIVEEVAPASALFAQVYSRAILCELERAKVFAGDGDPVIFGEPAEWLAHLIEAFRRGRSGDWDAASKAQALAFEAAPVTKGSLNDHAIEWVADADSRLGPVLEAFIEGHYRWIPFDRISKLTIPEPSHQIDKVWVPAKFVWTNRGSADGLIPVRYFGSEATGSTAMKSASLTEWVEPAPGIYTGLGQRLITSDIQEVGLLDVRELNLEGES